MAESTATAAATNGGKALMSDMRGEELSDMIDEPAGAPTALAEMQTSVISLLI